MKIFDFDAIVIGSGCAGYNAADRLYDYGVTNIAVVTEGVNKGTSRNTGSDKQTYYKLSLAGDEGDSVYKMAETLFYGGAVDGDIALCESANSVASFLKLCAAGVDFPTNEYGEYVGYKTDHDPFRRATSIGPYTSKKMTEALENLVKSKQIPIFDNCQVVKLLKDDEKIVGAVAINLKTNDYYAFRSGNIILATGGPASIYADSVYPTEQTGASALAIEAGAEFSNMSEWQYGLASIDFRWNVSGTYQQVLPRYISIDERGVEREFLLENFSSTSDMLKNIFLKGYEWPFDVRKLYGSSYIDLLVYRESVVLGRKVYLDFTREPSGLENGFENLDTTVYEYLNNSGALIATPIERLKKMNCGAVDLYKEHGIDLEREPLRIAVCAQHNNGGIGVDSNWQSSVSGLYACGEAAGTFGVFRPGGSALNSTQVGSMRAARHIAYSKKHTDSENFNLLVNEAVEDIENLKRNALGDVSTITDTASRYKRNMSDNFSFIRNRDKMLLGIKKIREFISDFDRDNRIKDESEICGLIKNKEMLLTQELTAGAMLEAACRYGSRGAAFVTEEEPNLRKALSEKVEGRIKVLQSVMCDEKIIHFDRDVRPIPDRELWFEKVWNDYINITKNRAGK